jgi:hypothetical protein
MSALTTRCTNPKILLASPGASTHAPKHTECPDRRHEAGQFRTHMLTPMARLVKGANLDQSSETVSRAVIRHRKSGTGRRALLHGSLASTEDIPKLTGAAASGAASVRGNAGRSRTLRLTPDCDSLAALRLLAKHLISPAVIHMPNSEVGLVCPIIAFGCREAVSQAVKALEPVCPLSLTLT